jgi:hypothetical protein
MASSSINAESPNRVAADASLTPEQQWDLILNLAGSAKEMYAVVGGSDAWIKAERAAWDQERVA